MKYTVIGTRPTRPFYKMGKYLQKEKLEGRLDQDDVSRIQAIIDDMKHLDQNGVEGEVILLEFLDNSKLAGLEEIIPHLLYRKNDYTVIGLPGTGAFHKMKEYLNQELSEGNISRGEVFTLGYNVSQQEMSGHLKRLSEYAPEAVDNLVEIIPQLLYRDM